MIGVNVQIRRTPFPPIQPVIPVGRELIWVPHTEVAQKGYEGIVLTSAAPPLSGALLARGGNAVS